MLKKFMQKCKTRKFNILLSILIILFGFGLGMILFMSPKIEKEVSSEVKDIPQDVVEEDYYDNDDYGLTQTIERPSDAFGIVNDAIKLYNTGAGCESTFKQTINVKASFGKLSGSGTQWAEGKILRCGNKNLEETTYTYGNLDPSWMEGIALQYDVLKTGHRVISVDQENNKVYFVEERNGGKVAEEIKLQDALDRFKIIYSMEFPLVLNKNTASVKNFDTRSNKGYDIITIACKLDKLPEKALTYLSANSKYRNVRYTSYEYTFYISKKTGKMLRMVRDEEFVSRGNGAASNLHLTSKSTFVQEFKVMDEKVEVPIIRQ